MGDWGFKVSLPGKDITSTDPLDYVFHSAYGSVKVVAEPPNKTYVSFAINAFTNATLQINHNLGFTPLVLVFTELVPGSGRWYCGIADAGPEDSTNQVFLNNALAGTYVDNNSVFLAYSNQSGSNKTIKVYYYIFGDVGN